MLLRIFNKQLNRKQKFEYHLKMGDQNEPESDGEEVKSCSLIKFESSNPKQFATLPAAVDLKRPPSNW